MMISGLMLLISLAMFAAGVSESVVNNRQMHISMRLTMHLKVMRIPAWKIEHAPLTT